MTEPEFIERHGLWAEAQSRLAAELRQRVEREDLRLIRLAWSDSHGAARAKSVAVPIFQETLRQGYNINVATSTLDASGGRVFRSFTSGGGMGLDEMTGSPNLIIVPDPDTFRLLPWAPGVGWVLCDEYFPDGRPFHFSTRRVLRRQLTRLAEAGLALKVGIEAEWYLAHLMQERLRPENIAVPGMRPLPPETTPVEPGYSYHSETNFDLMQPVVTELVDAYGAIGLPLRSMENEWGPGQLETTFTATDPLPAADNYILFRTATRQVCRRFGYFATFMSRPGIAGHYSSGLHIHQSLTDPKSGDNLMTPATGEAPFSPTGQAFLAGLMTHALPATVFATPTVNGYRRFQPNSLAPDRVTWSHDHRGTLMRTLGGPGDPASRIENRAGEPAANPYLLLASQIIAGLDGIQGKQALTAADENPYEADRPLLPSSLGDALEILSDSALFQNQLGELFFDYYLKLKEAELERFRRYCRDNNIDDTRGQVTQWEQNEYYDFF